MVHIVAAMTAGATGTCMTSPLWVIKTRLMVGARFYRYLPLVIWKC